MEMDECLKDSTSLVSIILLSQLMDTSNTPTCTKPHKGSNSKMADAATGKTRSLLLPERHEGDGWAGWGRAQAHLAIAGEGGVVEQEVGTKEEDNGAKNAQARPIEEDRPAQQGVLRYVPERERVPGKTRTV